MLKITSNTFNITEKYLLNSNAFRLNSSESIFEKLMKIDKNIVTHCITEILQNFSNFNCVVENKNFTKYLDEYEKLNVINEEYIMYHKLAFTKIDNLSHNIRTWLIKNNYTNIVNIYDDNYVANSEQHHQHVTCPLTSFKILDKIKEDKVEEKVSDMNYFVLRACIYKNRMDVFYKIINENFNTQLISSHKTIRWLYDIAYEHKRLLPLRYLCEKIISKKNVYKNTHVLNKLIVNSACLGHIIYSLLENT